MTTQKELERKLSTMTAPPPPPGLAARLKRDIPANLDLQPRPRRLAPGWGNVLMRLAALVVLAVGVGALGYRYFSAMPTAAPHSLAATNMSPRAPHWNSYEVARHYLTRGDIPPAAAINLNDLMDTFNYADPVRDSSVLYAEATENPFVSEPRSYLLLVGARNLPAAAADSRIVVAFDDLRVDSHAPISGSEAELYAVRLGAGLKADDVVARLTLEQNSAEVRTVRRRDLDSAWDHAPRGVKLAAVVAMWGEVLRQSDTGRRIDVNALSARAAEVSREFQQDARIGELARLIETTRRLQGVSQG
jgi:hypothetical protein